MTLISDTARTACEARIEALESDYGAAHTDRIVEAEAADFLWDGRLEQRYLGRHLDVAFGPDGEETELSRIAVVSPLRGRWYAAACLVDGEGRAADVLWKRDFATREAAHAAFERAG